MDRRVLFTVGLVASVGLTALLWGLGFPGFFLFLFLPFLWFPFSQRRKQAPACPACGAPMAGGFRFCPSCGARL